MLKGKKDNRDEIFVNPSKNDVKNLHLFDWHSRILIELFINLIERSENPSLASHRRIHESICGPNSNDSWKTSKRKEQGKLHYFICYKSPKVECTALSSDDGLKKKTNSHHINIARVISVPGTFQPWYLSKLIFERIYWWVRTRWMQKRIK